MLSRQGRAVYRFRHLLRCHTACPLALNGVEEIRTPNLLRASVFKTELYTSSNTTPNGSLYDTAKRLTLEVYMNNIFLYWKNISKTGLTGNDPISRRSKRLVLANYTIALSILQTQTITQPVERGGKVFAIINFWTRCFSFCSFLPKGILGVRPRCSEMTGGSLGLRPHFNAH